MSPEVEKRIVGSIDKITEWISSTEEFVLEQAPLIASEMVTLGRIFNTCVIIGTLFMFATAVFFGLRGLKMSLKYNKIKEEYNKNRYARDEENSPDADDSMLFLGIIQALPGLLLTVVSIVVFANHLLPFLTAWTAPRLYILQQLSELTK